MEIAPSLSFPEFYIAYGDFFMKKKKRAEALSAYKKGLDVGAQNMAVLEELKKRFLTHKFLKQKKEVVIRIDSLKAKIAAEKEAAATVEKRSVVENGVSQDLSK